MIVVTLTTDLGLKDPYVASVKGFLLSKISQVNIVDISHLISPFSIPEASYILRNCYHDFPEKSIHLISVNNSQSVKERFIAVKYNNHYFLGPDNGVISLITDRQADEVCEIPVEQSSQLLFPLKNLIAPAAVRLSAKFNMSAVGIKTGEFQMISSLNATVDQNMIKGMVIYIDNFGNAVTNISKKIFERFDLSKKIKIEFSGSDEINVISEKYSDVHAGDALCLFNSAGLLEIAINQGNASRLLGLQLKSSILIEFYD
ncbi:MAG: SAM-dependent chlorinase/fluorinase [Sphingobacteriales bacterium]|nr:SAM-dependent chlorinase/fluorinase [Sphingobacteriales bacterium]